MKLIEQLLSSLAWLQLFIAPALIGSFLGLLLWLNFRSGWGVVGGGILALLGIGVGIAFAEKARRGKGTIEFMSRTSAHPELYRDDKKNQA
ncbi:hypothetical protein ACFP2F_17585 [Hymenobacter artigasi]|uniref:AtpZ/AtpI family protein n=1 Tax=Hymenobacter artigasi TaxID=2719616 RepID=A0ABX1HLW2_9BACT|nr:hypothetical protein [Hymenobacter artigasi]NKI91248.1 hypothetical protein [Hymenobacter artigasi]